MIFRWLLLLSCTLSTIVAGEVTLRVEFPEKIVLPKPQIAKEAGEGFQTALNLRFTIENKTESGLQISTLDGNAGQRLLYPIVSCRLFDPAGKEIPGGYAAAESFAGSSALKEIVLPPGKAISLPYYRGQPFQQLTVAGTYTLKVSAQFRGEKDGALACEAKPVTFVVEFEK
jgi:hypothetical protein